MGVARSKLRLDAWRNPQTDVRLAVERWCVQEPVTEQFVEQPRSVARVWHYLRRVGPIEVWRKVWSRLAEQARDRKIAGVGIGRVLEAPTGGAFTTGQRVVFFAPNHSPDWPRLSLDAQLIRDLPACAHPRAPKHVTLPEPLRALSGWSPFAGSKLDSAAIDLIPGLMTELPRGEVMTIEPARERIEAAVTVTDRQTAVLFGLGNYAKTLVVPNIQRHLRLAAVHEIDPDQIIAARAFDATLDTSPVPRDGEHYDAWFIAGYHHSHAELAVRAISLGAYAVVEKPIVTTRDQFDALTRALNATARPKLFACFNRRYAEWNEWARADLGVARGEPIDVHSLVYEIPLPRKHWYNWPSSGSRIVSNGSHWLDYFHFLNDFSAVKSFTLQPLRATDFSASVVLENGAQMTLVLTETGSGRVGVRELMELRARDVTVRMIDSSDYQSENNTRVLRRGRLNPLQSFRRMYDSICRRIVAGDAGDSPASLRSTQLILDLEAEYRTVAQA